MASEPYSHVCPEWDLMIISPGDPEMDACLCFRPPVAETERVAIETKRIVGDYARDLSRRINDAITEARKQAFSEAADAVMEWAKGRDRRMPVDWLEVRQGDVEFLAEQIRKMGEKP